MKTNKETKMPVLVLKLASMWQSYGYNSHYEHRLTGRRPTKSAVIGMIAAAQGRERGDDLSDLSSLRFGSLTENTGTVETDYQIVHGEHIIKGSPSDKSMQTYREYLADAVFYVGIESDDRGQLENIEEALNHPVYALFLGRRSCPVNDDFIVGIEADEKASDELSSVLERYASPGYHELAVDYRPVDFVSYDTVESIPDSPVSFEQGNRSFTYRQVGVRQVLGTFVESPASTGNTSTADSRRTSTDFLKAVKEA